MITGKKTSRALLAFVACVGGQLVASGSFARGTTQHSGPDAAPDVPAALDLRTGDEHTLHYDGAAYW